MRKFLLIVCSCICIMGVTACSGGNKEETKTVQDTSDEVSDLAVDEEEDAEGSTLALSDTTREIATKDNLELKYGEIYDVYDGNANEEDKSNILILQVLLPEALEREIVLEQNFLNVEDLVKNQNCSVYDQIEYVAKVRNGENKIENVMSFVLDKNCMNQISTAAITVEEYEQNVKDLWVAELPIESFDGSETASTAVQSTDTTTESIGSTTLTTEVTTSAVSQTSDTTISTQNTATSTAISDITSSSTAEQQSEDTVPDYLIEENQ